VHITLCANFCAIKQHKSHAIRDPGNSCNQLHLPGFQFSHSLLARGPLMSFWTCEQCGAQFFESIEPPSSCPICEDERQFVNWKGQAWLTREDLAKCHNLVWRDDLGIPGIGVEPRFAIGQRALLLSEGDGCVMWDCVPLATDEAVEYVKSLSGLKAIAVSHPHFYGAAADWSEAFGGAPIYLHGDDRAFVTRPHPAIVPWSGETLKLSDDIMLVRAGGHFAGASVLHWRKAAGGRGALFTGDVAMVAMDRRSVSFMYSYPNYIPLNAAAVRRIADAVAPLAFDAIYGAWWDRNIAAGAKALFEASVRRYLAAIS
jgi:glyoxylase-like metal-dependent hydrolase (beta-lactamase superfamily II)